MRRGLSTWLWGPEMWQILHGISYWCDTLAGTLTKLQYDEVSRAWETFIGLLSSVLPCRHCRVSYEEFLKKEIEGTNLREILNRRMCSTLMYRVHERVNDKLDWQRFEGVMNTLPFAMASERNYLKLWAEQSGEYRKVGKRLTWESLLRKQKSMAGSPFTEESVWRIIMYAALGMDQSALKDFARWVGAFSVLLREIPSMKTHVSEKVLALSAEIDQLFYSDNLQKHLQLAVAHRMGEYFRIGETSMPEYCETVCESMSEAESPSCQINPSV
jgi:hypothetical protein